MRYECNSMKICICIYPYFALIAYWSWFFFYGIRQPTIDSLSEWKPLICPKRQEMSQEALGSLSWFFMASLGKYFITNPRPMRAKPGYIIWRGEIRSWSLPQLCLSYWWRQQCPRHWWWVQLLLLLGCGEVRVHRKGGDSAQSEHQQKPSQLRQISQRWWGESKLCSFVALKVGDEVKDSDAADVSLRVYLCHKETVVNTEGLPCCGRMD